MLKILKDKIKNRKIKKKKGFTLVELLAVIVILAVIMVITIPTVLGNMNEAKQQAFNTVGETMKKYLVDNYNNCRLGNKDIAKFDDKIFNPDCSLNISNGSFNSNLIKNSGYSTNDIEKVDVTFDGRGNFGVNVLPKEDGQFEGMKDETINSVPNAPDLSTGLVPIKYNGENWVVTTSTDPEWFDYANQKWANAASLVSGVSKEPGTLLKVPNGDEMTVEDASKTDILAMFVWVPRFSYTIGCTSSTSCYGYRIDGASPLESKTPGAIDIKFVGKDTSETYTGDSPTYTYTSEADRNPTNYYTHPAFTFGDDDLSGIWVGKFETSVNPKSDCYTALINKSGASSKCKYDYKNDSQEEEVTPRILPNVLSIVSQNVYNQFNTAKKFASNTMYGLTNKTDSHMMKNSEWGAVAYLSQSIYGKYGNSNYTKENKEIYKNDSGEEPQQYSYWARYTGRSQGFAPAINSYSDEGTYKYDDILTTDGTKEANKGTGASTTGNIYGIYDMSGGALEYVMSNYGTETAGVFTGTVAGSGIDFSKIDNKYYDKFTTTKPFETKTKETTGHAVYEVKKWYRDGVDSFNSWFYRSGSFRNDFNAGVFYGYTTTGDLASQSSFRSVLS